VISGIATLSLEPPPGSARRRVAARADSPAALREFLLGPENWLVRQGIGWSETAPGSLEFSCNPLVVYGPTGCGKSQFLHALSATWLRQRPADHVILIHATDFARGYATAVKLDDVSRFQQKYQMAGLVLLDGIDALEPKNAAQQQLASIMDHRIRAGRPLIVTAQQPLTAQKLTPRLISRLLGGLVVRLCSPAAETKREIIRRLAAQRAVPLSQDAERLLLEQRSLTITQLIGVFNRLRAAQDDADDCPSTPIRADRLRPLLAEAPQLAISPKDVIRSAAKHFGLPTRNLTGASRRKMDVLARSLAMYLIRELTGASFQQIGFHFGRRDHTTVMHACRKIRSAQDSDPAIQSATMQLRQRIVSDPGAPLSARTTASNNFD
jgi:chromosomal replication initiator protein